MKKFKWIKKHKTLVQAVREHKKREELVGEYNNKSVLDKSKKVDVAETKVW